MAIPGGARKLNDARALHVGSFPSSPTPPWRPITWVWCSRNSALEEAARLLPASSLRRPPSRRGAAQPGGCASGPRRAERGGGQHPAGPSPHARLCRGAQRSRRPARKHDEAIASFGQAVQLDPYYASAHWNQSLTWLLTGNFWPQGWREYEWHVGSSTWRAGVPGTLLGRLITPRTDDSAARRKGARRHPAIHPICALVQQRATRVVAVCPGSLVRC